MKLTDVEILERLRALGVWLTAEEYAYSSDTVEVAVERFEQLICERDEALRAKIEFRNKYLACRALDSAND
jgi:hypothetical protein